MKLIHIAKEDEPYYTKFFIHGFNMGAKRQFEADSKEATRHGRWETVFREVRTKTGVMLGIEECRECSVCHNNPLYSKWHDPMETDWCPWCGARMEVEE